MRKNSEDPERLLHQKRINSEELERALKAREKGEISFLLVDVREVHEYVSGHIAGVDMLLPTTQFEAWATTVLERYRDKTIVLTCRTSNRTAQVQEMLVQMGMKHVVDHVGGIVTYTGKIEQGSQEVQGV